MKKKAIIAYYFDWYNTNLLKNKKIYALVNCCSFLNLAQSEFIYLINLFIASNLNIRPNFKLFAKY